MIEDTVRTALREAVRDEPYVTGTAAAVRRRARRRTIVRTTVAALAVPPLALAGLALARPHGGGGGATLAAAVPWRDLPVAVPAVPHATPAPEGTRECDVEEFDYTVAAVGTSDTTTVVKVGARLRDDTPCAVRVQGFLPLLDPPAAIGTVVSGTQSFLVSPGDVALLSGSLYGACGDRTVELRVGDGLHTKVVGDIAIPHCVDPVDSGETRVELEAYTVVPADSPEALVPTVTGPATAQPGAPYDFDVTLHNTTGTAVALDPCPTYTVSLSVLATGHTTTTAGTVNCADAPATVGPYGTLTLRMRVDVPAEYLSNPVRLHWSWSDVEDRWQAGCMFADCAGRSSFAPDRAPTPGELTVDVGP